MYNVHCILYIVHPFNIYIYIYIYMYINNIVIYKLYTYMLYKKYVVITILCLTSH